MMMSRSTRGSVFCLSEKMWSYIIISEERYLPEMLGNIGLERNDDASDGVTV